MIVNQKKIKKYKEQLNIIHIPVVSLDWVEKCLLKGRFLPPKLGELLPNRKGLKSTKSGKKTPISEQEFVSNILGKKDSSDMRFNYLSKFRIAC